MRQKINNINKHNKDFKNIRIEKDSLQPTLNQTNVNYLTLKTKKDFLSGGT